MRPWILAGTGLGSLAALLLLYQGAAGNEQAEGVMYFTLVCTRPSAFVFLSAMSFDSWWLFVLLSWSLQGSLCGAIVGLGRRARGWSRPASALALVAAELVVPATMWLLFSRS